jgi:pimeloyl-ACP methyl ester carboxylesterase
MPARLLAADRSNRVAALILIDPAVEHQDRRLAAVAAAAGSSSAQFIDAVRACSTGVINGTMRSDMPGSKACLSTPSASLTPRLNAARQALQQTRSYQQTILSELESVSTVSSDQLDRSGQNFRNIPLLVLTAERSQDDPSMPAAEQAALRKQWWAMHEELARRSRRGEHRIVAGASHFIPTERPEVVVSATSEMVMKVRAQEQLRR